MTENEKIRLEDIRQRLFVLSNTNPSYHVVMAEINIELFNLIKGVKETK